MPGYTPYYGSYMPNYYQPMQNYQQPVGQTGQPTVPTNNQPFLSSSQSPLMPQNQPGIIWVQNEAQANEYLVAPNNAVALWDSNSPVIYLKQADASGKPHMTIYDLVERTQSPVQAPHSRPIVEYATKEQFETLAAKANELEAKLASLAATKNTSKKPAAKEETDNG